MCRINNGAQTVEHYYNAGQSTPSLLISGNPQIGISNVKVTVSNNVLTCSFTRAKSQSGVPNYFDINNYYYLLTATGLVSGGVLQFHSKFTYSDVQYNFGSITSSTVATTSSAISSTAISMTTTATTSKSDSINQYKNGDFTLNWSVSADSINFEFLTNTTSTSNFWTAFAFSTDATMVCFISK